MQTYQQGAVPRDLRTKDGWKLNNRRVKTGETPCAQVETRKLGRAGGRLTVHPDGTREEIRSKPVLRSKMYGLFTEDQTKRFKPTALELAHRKFYNIFVKPLNQQKYIWDNDGWQW